MLKSRHLYIPHQGRDRYAYEVVNNYLSNYKNTHTFFLAFRKQKSLKLDLLGVKSGCGFSNSDVTRFQVFSQTMSCKYTMAQYQKKLRKMKLLGFGLFTKNSGEGHFDPHKMWLRCEPAFPLSNIKIKIQAILFSASRII